LLAAVKGKSLFLRVAFSIVVPMAFFPESANMKARWLRVESSPGTGLKKKITIDQSGKHRISMKLCA
jgi:hypothetical protein